MGFDCFKELPDNAQLWIFAFPQDLDSGGRQVVESALTEFCAGWRSHDATVAGGYTIYKDRFAIVAGITTDGLSGCSKDSMVRVFKTLHIEHNLNALDDMLVHFQKDGQVSSVARTVFEDLCGKGDISPDTIVYNCSLQHLGELRSAKFECTFSDSWHASAFRLG